MSFFFAHKQAFLVLKTIREIQVQKVADFFFKIFLNLETFLLDFFQPDLQSKNKEF